MEVHVQRLALAQITRHAEIQQRAGGLQEEQVHEYAEAMQEDAPFPPVVVYADQHQYWLADGFHRCAAAEIAGVHAVDAEIRSGTRRDALLYAAGANDTHGLRRTNADKRKAAITLLEDPEWRQWSDHEIARRTHTTQPFVTKVRRELINGGAVAPVTTRQGGDGRTIDTENIGKSSPLDRLNNAWLKASDTERRQWLSEHHDEIVALRLHAA